MLISSTNSTNSTNKTNSTNSTDKINLEYSELELLSVNNELEKIKLLDFNYIDEDMCNKIFTRSCEKGNIEIIKFIFPFCDKKIFNHGIFACLYFKHIDSASYIFYNIINDIENFKNYICYYYEVFFNLDNFEAINFLLNSLPKYTISYCVISHGFYGCPFLIGIRKNSYKTVKLFLDFLIKNNDYVKLDLVLNLHNNHGFYTVCQENYLEIAKYLCEIKPYYHIEIENDKIKKYYVDQNYLDMNNVELYNITPLYTR